MIDDRYLDKFMEELERQVPNLYEGLDVFLRESETREMENYWYEYDAEIIYRILENFSDADWKKLVQNAQLKSNDWKQKLAYCLTNNENKHELEILLEFASTDDDDLFFLTIDALRDYFNTEECKAFIRKKRPAILARVESRMPNAGVVRAKLYELFLEQMNE